MRRLSLIAVAACAPVLVIAYAVTTTHRERAVDTASVATPAWGTPAGGIPARGTPAGGIPARGTPAGGTGAGGWGRGGYTMMPGPAANGAANGAANAAAMTSENWAGYASAGGAGTFTSVSASWTEPAVTCAAANTFASFWVGLDGDGTNTVEQTGTEADCDGGAATYQGWFEMFPAAPVFYDDPVEPGDAMSASVVAGGGGAFTLTLTDSTRDWTQTTQQTSDTAQLGSAEVITEAPGNGTVLPLSDFGTVSFTGATVDGTAIGNENPGALTMVPADGVTEATPSALTGGNAFTVTWDGDGATTSAAPPPTSAATATGPATAPATTAGVP